MRQIPAEIVFFFPKKDYKLEDLGSGPIDMRLGQLLQAFVQIIKEDATILEIGAGLSTKYIASCLERRTFYTCDLLWEQPKEAPDNFRVVSHSSEILLREWNNPITERERNIKLDLLWIDGDHSYGGCMNDLGFTKFLVSGGFLLIHDAYNAGVPGVKAACDEVITPDKYHIYQAVGGLWEEGNVLLTNYDGDLTHKPDPLCCLFAVKK